MEGKKHHIVSLSKEQIPAAGALLAEVFFNDHLTVTCFPDSSRRERIFRWYCMETVRNLSSLENIYVTADVVKGVAVWVPPGSNEEMPVWEEQDGAQEYARFVKVAESLAQVRQATRIGPCWYLAWLGVAPSQQRQGLGGALLAPVLSQADQTKLPCYLETFEEENLHFYRRYGFEVAVNQIEPESGLELWTMKREPRQL